MFYLFTQTFFWLSSVFIAGFMLGWWLRGKSDVAKQTTDKPQPATFPTLETVWAGDSKQQIPDDWAPAGLVSSPVNGRDNLKLIKGIGPKLEERLNNLGFYKYSQLASLNTNNIAWVVARLKSSKKMPIEEWVQLAREKLAEQQAKSEQKN